MELIALAFAMFLIMEPYYHFGERITVPAWVSPLWAGACGVALALLTGSTFVKGVAAAGLSGIIRLVGLALAEYSYNPTPRRR